MAIPRGNSSNYTVPLEKWRSVPQLDIINSTTNEVQQRIQTDNKTGRTFAVDPETAKLIVPLKSGIAIYKVESNATKYLHKSDATRAVLDSYVSFFPLILVVAAFFV